MYKDPEERRAYDRAYYARQPEEVKKRKQELQNIRREACRQVIHEYKLEHPCVDCGEPDPIVLDFDHLPNSDKEFNISDAIIHGYSMNRVFNEVAKCVVRCANCHRRITYYRRVGE